MDAFLFSGIVTGVLGLFFSFFAWGTDELFIEPAVAPLKKFVTTMRSFPKRRLCRECDEELLKPFFEISMKRKEIVSNLASVSAGLLIQFIILIILEKYIEAITALIISLAPILLCSYYAIKKRDVFSWWKHILFRVAVSSGVLSISFYGSMGLYLDFVKYFIFWDNKIVILDRQTPYYHMAIWITSILVLLYCFKTLKNIYNPSLRNTILNKKDETQFSGTINDWTNILKSSNPKKSYQEMDVKDSLNELVYQGLIKMTITTRDGDIIYE